MLTNSGNVFVRREVRDLKDNFPDQWTLYMLALESLHWSDQKDPYSFFGLASIHGRPYKTWGDAPGLSYKIGTAGYCPHGNELFMPWHRPYLALFEAILSSYVHEIAVRAPADQVERYLAAANEFRMPYWDWAQGVAIGTVPEFFLTPTLTIDDTDGSEITIYNPLYSYKFKPIPDGFDGKWRYINETIRWPDADDPWGRSQQWRFVEAFKEQASNLVAQMGVVFRSSTFSRFSSTLEDPHGWIHGIIGGGFNGNVSPNQGHMWPLEYSSYEPLFMLHHANIDRLFSLYQAAHPDRWMESSNIGPHGNVFLEDNQAVDANTPLLPFRKDGDSFWTFNDSRNTSVLGYAYPETQAWLFPSATAYQENVTAKISTLYAGTAKTQLLSQQATAATSSAQTILSPNNSFTDWTIEASAIASTMPSSFIVSFSLVALFQSDPIIDVGSWMVLMPERIPSVTKRPRVVEKVIRGTTSLTSHLIGRVEAGVLRSLEPEDVVPFLGEFLSWVVW
ncbi:Di-copper centre-containing protein, partial [Decorospora gaudefroyi]